MQIVTGQSFFEDMLGDIQPTDQDGRAAELYPFFCRVGVIKRRPPRHEFFTMMLDMGSQDVVKVLNKEKIDKEILSFVFPERWMNQPERQIFMPSMIKNPGVENIKQVDMITTDPLLVGNFFAEQIRIVTWPEDSGLYDGHGDKT